MTAQLKSTQEAVDFIFKSVGLHVRLAAPLGLGKPNSLLNAIYEDVKKSPEKKLKIFTALSLNPPDVKEDIAKRFLDPFSKRQWGENYPRLKYYIDAVHGKTPSNVEVHEFYFQAGTALKSKSLQRNYQSVNYTHVAEDILASDLNVGVQLVAKRQDSKGTKYSLSCNPDVTLDMMDLYKASGKKMWLIGVVHPDLPYLEGEAEVEEGFFDAVLETEDSPHLLFALPRTPVSAEDHLIGFYASQLMPDNGTIQIGIGSLSDAVVSALILRQKNNEAFRSLAKVLKVSKAELEPFSQGLYGLTEMLTDGYMHLRKSGLLQREVVDETTKKRTYLHGSFFLGSKPFYKWLKDMKKDEAQGLRMTRVSKVNDLFDPEEAVLRKQRINARFYNTTMQVTLLGEAMSETLANGGVVSGVGGQYNFVAMSRELKGARSILMLRSARIDANGKRQSNILWEPGHVTIPRHLRDIVVTEYGVADLRGKSDSECIQAMIQISDSEFQEGLLRKAKEQGKISDSFVIPDSYRHNTSENIRKFMKKAEFKTAFKPFPFGSDFTPDEERIALALSRIQEDRKISMFKLLQKAMKGSKKSFDSELERLDLLRSKSLKDRFYQRLLRCYLEEVTQ